MKYISSNVLRSSYVTAFKDPDPDEHLLEPEHGLTVYREA